MIAAERLDRGQAKLLLVDEDGALSHLARRDLAHLLKPGDLAVANDAATLPASLAGIHGPTCLPIELRLAGWMVAGDVRRFVALAFGAGDHRTPTENRPPPPGLAIGDRLRLGPLIAVVERLLGHPRLLVARFVGERAAVLAGIAAHGRPIQYAHVSRRLRLEEVWTSLAAVPTAFEPPSAGFALDWELLAAWRRRGVGFAALTHAAGVSSTGDPALDRHLPFDEPYDIPAETAAVVNRTRAAGGRVVAIGTTVVRALEAAADGTCVRAGAGVARQRIGPLSRLRVVDAMITGMHRPGESHFELLRAFADDPTLDRLAGAMDAAGYRAHEFGDSMLIVARRRAARPVKVSPQLRALPASQASCAGLEH